MVKAFRDDSGPAGHCTFGAHINILHVWLGPEKPALCETNQKKKIYIFTVALRVHVLMVKFIPLLQVVLQNNGVTFDLIFVDGQCEISMLFPQPGKFAASFCGFGEL